MGLKKYQQLIIILLYIHISGCYPENNQSTINPPVKYMAHLNGDTAIATLKQSPNIFNGILEIHYKGNYKDSGDVRGVIKGDTLFV